MNMGQLSEVSIQVALLQSLLPPAAELDSIYHALPVVATVPDDDTVLAGDAAYFNLGGHRYYNSTPSCRL
jgi:hypothetical protein